MVFMRSFLYLLGGFVLFSIAATFFLLPEHNKNSEKNTDEGVKFSFDITPTSATPNDTFWFVLSIVNHSNDTAKFLLPTPLPARFTVYRNGRPIWNSDYGMMFIQMITPFKVAPGDSIPLKSFWLGKDNSAKLQPLGKYIVEACFLGNKKCFKDSLWLVD